MGFGGELESCISGTLGLGQLKWHGIWFLGIKAMRFFTASGFSVELGTGACKNSGGACGRSRNGVPSRKGLMLFRSRLLVKSGVF